MSIKSTYEPHRELVLRIIKEYREGNAIKWKRLRSEHPEWYSTMNVDPRNKVQMTRLSHYVHGIIKRQQHLDPSEREPIKKQRKKYLKKVPAVEAKTTSPVYAFNYCPNCGCDVHAIPVAIALRQ